MTNSADPDQLASSPTDLDLRCLLRQDMSFLAREGLSQVFCARSASFGHLDLITDPYIIFQKSQIGLNDENKASRKHAYIILTPFNPSFI